ncbi:MAG: hypothetical protein M0R05_00550 [Bacilli bacterium]|nr:hypothetical protein [Bacilli bacterium]MDD4076459.1 hypothetical protein [Bacilli bacterium]MDD4388254.1 hypothetical protein [Bacilli bacterium]
MRRYYQAKLKGYELAIKLLVIMVLVESAYFFIALKFDFINILKYIVIPFLLILVIFVVGIIDHRRIRSFYFKDNYMTIGVNREEYTFCVLSIESLELLSDIDSLFGYKKVIIKLKGTSKKRVIFLDDEKARKFIFWIQAKLENYKEPFIDDLYLFFSEGEII